MADKRVRDTRGPDTDRSIPESYAERYAREHNGCLCGKSEDVGWREQCPIHGKNYQNLPQTPYN